MMKKALIIFTRLPKPGQTKTRLMPYLSGEECAALHTSMLCDLADLTQKLDSDVFVFFTPKGDAALLKMIFPEAVLLPQSGSDLGERMDNALTFVLAKAYESCLLIGSDIPFLTVENFKQAYAELRENDLVLGPADDGGYYLIGLKEPFKPIFENQRYSEKTVLERALDISQKAGKKFALIQKHRDIDIKEDLEFYCRLLDSKPQLRTTNTGRYIFKLMADEL